MSYIFRPLKRPPQLSEYETLSTEAQRTLAVIEDKYNYLLREVESLNTPRDSSDYYRSIYKASFHKNANDATTVKLPLKHCEYANVQKHREGSLITQYSPLKSPKVEFTFTPQNNDANKEHPSLAGELFGSPHKRMKTSTNNKLEMQSSDEKMQENVLPLIQNANNLSSPAMDFEEVCSYHKNDDYSMPETHFLDKPEENCLLELVRNSQEVKLELFPYSYTGEDEVNADMSDNACHNPVVKQKPCHNSSVKASFRSSGYAGPASSRCGHKEEVNNRHQKYWIESTSSVPPEIICKDVASVDFELYLSDLEFSQNSHSSVSETNEVQDVTNTISSAHRTNVKHLYIDLESPLQSVCSSEQNKIALRKSTELTLVESPTCTEKEELNLEICPENIISRKSEKIINDLYENESPTENIKCAPKRTKKVPELNVKKQKKISDAARDNGDNCKSGCSGAVFTNSRKDGPKVVKQTTIKRRSCFKPPNKVKPIFSLDITSSVQEECRRKSQSSLSVSQDIVHFISLNPAEREETLGFIKSSLSATLTLLYSTNMALVNTFHSSADYAKASVTGIVILTERCFLIPLELMSETLVRDAFLHVLSSMRTIKIIPNCKEFLKALHKISCIDLKQGIHVQSIQDPVIASWLLDPETQPSNFEDLCKTVHLQVEALADWTSCLQCTPQLMQALRSKLETEKLWHLFTNIEMRLVPILACMETQTVRVNMEKLSRFSDILKCRMRKLEEGIYKEAGHRFVINSHVQLRQVLYEELKLDRKLSPNTKIDKTHVLSLKSTCEASLSRLVGVHPLPALILEHRHLQKLKSTYVEGIMSCVHNGTLSTHWDQTAAATGRLTSYIPNIQAVPKTVFTINDFEENYVIGSTKSSTADINAREPFISNDGYVFLAADFQQIELRIVASLSGDRSLLSIFWQIHKEDIFSQLTSQWKHKLVASVTHEEREQTKRIVYSVLYGVGKEKLSEYLKVQPSIAKEIMNSFLSRFPAIDSFTKKCWNYARMFGYTETLCGRRRYFPHINSSSPVLKAQAKRQAVNFCVQGSAADICKLAMLAVEDKMKNHRHLSCRLLLQIHDELVWEVPESQLLEIRDIIQQSMENIKALCNGFCTLQVPLTVALSSGTSWAHLTSLVKDIIPDISC